MPSGGKQDPLKPEETVALGELTGRLAKSEWGLTREQSELVLGAMLRLGYLIGLDAFLQPLRFEQVAAPLSDFLPYLAHGRALEGEPAEAVCRLQQAVTGATGETWDLPAQEQARGASW